ncbi:MAG: adenylate/guanylate cyclase domain-containing protein [Chlorobi bacterium]|nr:adenylate/guanylate cyclase domain-containing protein [Chlorobiota bacterium]
MRNNNKKQISYDKISANELFYSEFFESERLRAAILIGLLGFEAFFLIIIYFFYKEPYFKLFGTNIGIYAILIFTVIIIIYELIIFLVLNKKRKIFSAYTFEYFNIFSEISLLSLLLIFIVEYSNNTVILQTPASLTFFIFIVLSTFHLNFRLSVFSGILAASEFILISVYYSNFSNITNNMKPDLTGMQYLGEGLIMIITGIAAGFAADLIKKKILVIRKNIQEKNEIINLFGQQISPQIAENILKNKNELSGVRKKVCIMFLDIRNFTPFVEQRQPEEVVTYLNSLFGFMIDIIQEYEGVINQFLGDGFMATFGAPVSLKNNSLNATEASKKILKKLKNECRKGNIPETEIGIGLHYDEAVTGNIGSSERKQFSITGKVVIIASRIEQLNKKYNTNMLISKNVFEELDKKNKADFEKLEEAQIKGSKKRILLYKLKSIK